MHFLKFSILILFVSCIAGQKQTKNSEEALVLNLIEQYYKHGPLQPQTFVSPTLLPFKYYDYEQTGDGIIVPPTEQNIGNFNEQSFFRIIRNNEHFKVESESNWIKEQILNSNATSKIISLKNLNNHIANKTKSNRWYSFYIPIFNTDSSAVYLQYDYFDGGYEEGRAALMVTSNGEWKLIETYHIWMN